MGIDKEKFDETSIKWEWRIDRDIIIFTADDYSFEYKIISREEIRWVLYPEYFRNKNNGYYRDYSHYFKSGKFLKTKIPHQSVKFCVNIMPYKGLEAAPIPIRLNWGLRIFSLCPGLSISPW
jgi:hypothetical protein